MKKHELAELSGVSMSFLSDITTGKGNPSLEVMEDIANALQIPLPYLLETTDLDSNALEALTGGRALSNVPPGYERVFVVLPEHKAFLVRKWGEETKRKIRDKN